MVLKQTKQYTIYKYKYANRIAGQSHAEYLGLWVSGDKAQYSLFSAKATDEQITAVMEQNVRETFQDDN